MLTAADLFCRCIEGTSATSAGTNVRNDEGAPRLGGGFGWVGGGIRLVLFFGLLSLVCLSVVLGEAFATGVRGCAFGWVARFRARVVDAAGDAPAWAGSAAPAEFPPGFGHRSGHVAPVLGPGLPLRVGGAVQEFVPRVTTTGVCQAEDPTSPCGAATSPKGGMHSICVSLYGASTRVGARSLSLTPARVVAACWGDRGNRTGRGRSRPYATAQPRLPPGVSGFPVANALPCRGRPPFCVPGDGIWRHGRRRTELPGVCRCGDCRICVLYGSTGCVTFWGSGAASLWRVWRT